jgi:NADPH2:quinone reductase
MLPKSRVPNTQSSKHCRFVESQSKQVMNNQRWIVNKPGAIDHMRFESFDIVEPGDDEIQIRQFAIGVNMIDTYVISGDYDIDPYPLTPGVEGAGRISAVGQNIKEFSPGDRVAYGGPPLGAYATTRNMKPDYVVKIPDQLQYEDAAAIMISGLTAQMMVKRVYPVNKKTKVLVHGAAGSSGDSLVRWSKHLGATVFGTVGSTDKEGRAKAAGCDHVINYSKTNFSDEILRLTSNEGVDVVYDGIGATTYSGSLESLTLTGTFVTFGQASGPLPPIDLSKVHVTFSNSIVRPSVFSFNAKRDSFLKSVDSVFNVLHDQVLDSRPGHKYALADAPQALRDLQSRKTVGSIILIP